MAGASALLVEVTRYKLTEELSYSRYRSFPLMAIPVALKFKLTLRVYFEPENFNDRTIGIPQKSGEDYS